MKYRERVVLALAFMLIIYTIVEMAILLFTPKEEIPPVTLTSTYTLAGEVEEEPKRKESTVSIAHEVEEIEKVEYVIYEVTAYTEGFESTGKRPGDHGYGEVAASGTVYANFEPLFVKENYTIACGPEHEFGTEFYIPYFDNTFTCEDRGGAITEGKLDVYIPNLVDALEFGRREIEVIVIASNDFEIEKRRWHK
jgi:3D (Asp-Asp-Asp) domain-containing protein